MKLFLAMLAVSGTSAYAACGVTDWKAINLDNVAPTEGNVHMTSSKTELEITGLKYDYEECVEPSDVSFEAFEKNAYGNCGTVSLGKSPSDASAVIQFVGTPAKQTAAINLTIAGNNINADKP